MKSSESRYNKCLYFSANALARKIEKIAVDSWKEVNLSPSHGYLLMIVLDAPGVQPTVISKELQLTPSTITRLIEKLEAAKLLVRTAEGKLTNIYPTPKAKELYPKMKSCVNNFYQKYTTVLGEQESGRMVASINKLNDKLST
jgi:MarR family transcriptional regulator, organic hydroperoxide resistance regulator